MKIRRIEKEDLPLIAKLAKDKTIETMEDIDFKHSRICLSDNGEVLCFVVLRERSLIDFFNGDIPADENPEIMDDEYEEGDEWLTKEEIESEERHYEVIAMYDNGEDGVPFNRTLTSAETNGDEDRKKPRPHIGILWTTKEQPKYSNFYNFNNIVWLDMP